MRTLSLEQFKNDVNDIREYMIYINNVSQVAKKNINSNNDESLTEFCNHLRTFRKSKKLFEYKSIVISLYGILEKYINLWIHEHLTIISNTISDYSRLSEIIKRNHFNFSIKLISMISENRYVKYEHLKKELVLKNLNDCILFPDKFNLNLDSFTITSGNLKHNKILEALKNIEVDLKAKIKHNNNFIQFLDDMFGENHLHREEKVFDIIDELVTRRNDISHGQDVDDILNISEFERLIVSLEHYCEAIFDTLVEKETKYESEHCFFKINDIINVYKKGSILCFKIANYKIKKGDTIITKSPKGYFAKKKILEIQYNNTKLPFMDITEEISIGVDLGGGITNKHTFFLMCQI